MTPKDRKLYENLQILVYALQLEDDQWPFEYLTKQEAFNEVIKLEASLNLGFSPDNPQFLSLIEKKIYEILSQPPEQPVGNIPPKTILEADLKKGFDSLQQKKIEHTYPTLNEQIKKIHQDLSEKIRNQLLIKEPQLKTNQGLLDIAARELTDKILNNLPPTKVKATLFTLQEYEGIINKAEPEINKTISRLGFPEKKITSQEKQTLLNQTFKETQILSATPRRLVSFEKRSELQKLAKDTLKIPPLPKEIKDNLFREAETAQLKLNPVFVMLQPKTGFALTRKLFYAPRIASLKLALEEIKPEYQQLIAQGLLPEDLQITIDALKEMGLKEDSPILEHLKNQTAYLKDLEEQTPLVFKNIRRFYQYEDLTGQKEVYYLSLDMKLPLHRKSLWQEKGSYSYYVKTGLDRFRFVSNISQRTIKFLSKGKYKTPLEFLKRGVAKRAGKWFLKTAVGKALKSGFKKIGIKIAIKLGIKAGIAAAGAATGPPGWVVAAVALVIDKVIALAKKGVLLIQKIIRDPEKAFMAVAAGALILVLAPMPLALIGVVPLSFGVIGLASFVATPAALGSISTGIGAFFSSIATLPVTTAVVPFVIILFAVLAGLTMFIVMVVSGAFILPNPISTTEAELISPYESEFFNLRKTAGPKTNFDNSEIQSGIIIEYTITIAPKNGAVLVHPKITDQFSISSKTSLVLQNPILPCNFNLPEIITSPETFTCTKRFDENFKDTAIVNVVTLNTEIEGKTAYQKGLASATVIIGEPPGECPGGWPVNALGARITQGPNAGYSHQGQEAIDIALNNGTPVFATHEGFVQSSGRYGGGGISISIAGKCDGIDFYSYYAHLQKTLVSIGRYVSKGTLIGLSDNTGNSTGPHLHYEFITKGWGEIKMAPPYIPQVVPDGCRSSGSPCGTI